MIFTHSNQMSNQTGWRGTLNLVYGHQAATTQIIEHHAQAPLKIQRPFYPEGPEICHSVILHTAGGIVGGDQLAIKIHLQPHACALITTAAASKVYRSNGSEARQNIEIKIEAGGCLEWVPQEAIIFNQALYRQNLKVDLAADATWLGWEIQRFGRSARGERFLQGNWRSDLEIWQQETPLWIDRQGFKADEKILNSPYGLSGYPIMGSLAWIGQEVPRELLEKIRLLWDNDASQNLAESSEEVSEKLVHHASNFNTLHPRGQVGVTRLTKGLLCRYRGFSTSEVRTWFIAVWRLLRPYYLDRPSCLPRVWPIG